MGDLIQFTPRPRRKRPRLGPLIRVPNAIEEVFVKAVQDTSPCEMIPYHKLDEPA